MISQPAPLPEANHRVPQAPPGPRETRGRLPWRTLAALALFASIAPASPSENGDASSELALPAPMQSQDVVRFQNGDILYGDLRSLDFTNGIVWARREWSGPVRFQPGSALEVQLGEEGGAAARSDKEQFRLLLTNGDEVKGVLVKSDPESLTLDTAFAGELVLNRGFIRAILPTPLPPPPVYEGPQGLEGWTLGEVDSIVEDAGQWKHQDGAFYAEEAASIARDIGLPDVARIEFDLAWKGTLHIAVALYTDYMQPVKLASRETEPPFGAFYSLQLNNYYANLLPVKQDEPLRFLGQAGIPALGQKRAVHIEVLASKPRKTIALLVDGAFVKEWTDTTFSGEGTGVRLVHQGQGSVKLSHLVVHQWDGQREEKPSLPPGGMEDRLKRRNGETFFGKATEIGPETVMFQTRAGDVRPFPFEDVKQLELAWKPAAANPTPTTVRAFFRRGGRLTFELQQWADGTVQARSPSFGEAQLAASAFERFLFDLEPE